MNVKLLNILLADDDIDDCILFKEAVDEYLPPVHLKEVHDGEQLMRLLTDESNEIPHALFLDLNMPRKNGFECLSEIKLSEKLKHLTVIIFSTSLEQTVVNRLYENGAQHFIRKPPGFLQFKTVIQQTLTRIIQGNISKSTKETFVLKVQNAL